MFTKNSEKGSKKDILDETISVVYNYSFIRTVKFAEE